MKMLDEVAVVCDHRTVASAFALRGVLEQFRLQVRLHRLVLHREALDFFAGQAPTCPYTVLMSTATSGEDSDGSIRDIFEGGLRFHVVQPDYTGDADHLHLAGWDDVFVDLTPSTIPNLVTAAGGTLVALAGQESLVQPFLAAGYDAVIAPAEPPPEDNAALLFAIGFFYFAMSQDAVARDPTRPVYSDEQAVAQAAALNSARRDRTAGYRYHRRAG